MGQRQIAIVLGCKMTQELCDAIGGPDYEAGINDNPVCSLWALYMRRYHKRLDYEYGVRLPTFGFPVITLSKGSLSCCLFSDVPYVYESGVSKARKSFNVLAEWIKKTYGIDIPSPQLYLMEVERA